MDDGSVEAGFCIFLQGLFPNQTDKLICLISESVCTPTNGPSFFFMFRAYISAMK